MLSFRGGVWLLRKQNLTVFNLAHLEKCIRACFVTSESTSHGLSNSLFKSLVPEGVAASKCIEISINSSRNYLLQSLPKLASCYSLAASGFGSQTKKLNLLNSYGENYRPGSCQVAVGVPLLPRRCITTAGDSVQSASHQPSASASVSDVAPRIKFKRLDKTARHITQIIDKEAIEEVRAEREIPDIKPGYIVQLKVEVPENKRRVSILKGIVIARRNAGFNTTFRIRRLVAGVGVESLFHLYSPNIKEIKVLDKKKVRRAKLYYLRDKMNALKKQ